MNDKLKMNLFFVLVLLVLLGGAYYFFDCQLRTYWFRVQTDSLKADIDKLECYDNIEITQEYFDENCVDKINEYNNLTADWVNLKCVDIKIEDLMP